MSQPNSALGEELAELYKIRFADGFQERKSAIWQVLCDHFFSKFVPADATVLDVACGYGEFSNHINAKRKIGVDLNPDSKECLRPEIEFHLTAADALEVVGQNAVDVAFTSNFLEHLPHKDALMRVLRAVHGALRPGGRFVIMGPNIRYVGGAYWDFLDHTLALSHVSVAEGLQLAGFDIELVHKKFLPYTTQGALPTHPMLVRVYLSLPIAWHFFGKQFLVVARKPKSAVNVT
jgi:SAM-dependent methyltransferase